MALTKVQTGGLTNDAVTATKIADNSVDTAQLVADAVDNTILDVASDFAFTGTISGAGGLSSPLGNSVTYTSDGGAVTKNLAQSVSKMWVSWNGTGSVAVRDSLNLSSVTDSGTGLYKPVINSNMSNTNYAHTGNHNQESNHSGAVRMDNSDVTTTLFRMQCREHGNGNVDANTCGAVVHGDLA